MKGGELLMKKYAILASVVTFVATMFANVFASYFFTYQPKTPKCLDK
jgi:cyclic lactone autoinducer peptide